MKKHTIAKQGSRGNPGFTLVEIAIAIGMMAVMISSFMVVFGPAIQGIDKSLSTKDADRMANALEHELSVVRTGETYATPFEKAFWWIKQSPLKSKNPVLIYQYRGDPASVRSDGTLNPYSGSGNIAGVNYVIQTSVRRLNDAFHTDKIEAELAPGVLQGKVYYVKMSQLRYDADGNMVDTTSPNNITKLQPPHDNTATPANYTEDAVLPFRARFYEVKPPIWSFITNTWAIPGASETPVFTKNMAVTR